MKQSALLLFTIIIFASCSNLRKVQVIKDALSKSDTAQYQLLSEKSVVDSAVIVKEIVDKITSTKLDFTTMNARLKVDYETIKNADTYIANISIKKDSAIFVTIRGAMGVIGLKALINKDTVVLIYPLDKKTVIRPISYLQEIIKIPFTFSTIQDFLIGNPIFMDSTNVVSYKMDEKKLQVSLLGVLFKNLISLSEDNSKIMHLKLDDIDLNQHRTCDISYSDHTLVGIYQFPLYRDIAIAAQSRLEVHMEVKEFSFNEQLKYRFAIPRPGKRR
jgi:hypothetical protein